MENKKIFIIVTVAMLLLFAGIFHYTQSKPEEQSCPIGVDCQLYENESNILGNPNAKVKIIEYSDLECPYCKSFHDTTFKQIKEEYIDTGKVSFEFKHFPLTFHPNALPAAQAVECATEQGKRWPMINRIYSNDQLSAEIFKKYAKELGLNEEKFSECINSGQYNQKISDDFNEGRTLGVSGTPSFFINGIKIEGARPFSDFKSVIDSQLN